MQINKNGIPLDIPGQQKKVSNIRTTQKLHNDFSEFNEYATMTGYEDGCFVTAVVPVKHPDFKKLISQGYRLVETWRKGEIA
ncbi:hypothetical protein MTP04_02390 [Lysinibacillus sp. PLM2]|nr:hypothetical protein MTP04_02390 [Lysinibacillus sp. PLM2]